mmetsp:Transcript_17888/g.45758  ORF Transcript_17888/g.45758 Transcript_17888/m.45758 type:complete len:241 (+) Transcript_17888:352-1074(+)
MAADQVQVVACPRLCAELPHPILCLVRVPADQSPSCTPQNHHLEQVPPALCVLQDSDLQPASGPSGRGDTSLGWDSSGHRRQHRAGLRQSQHAESRSMHGRCPSMPPNVPPHRPCALLPAHTQMATLAAAPLHSGSLAQDRGAPSGQHVAQARDSRANSNLATAPAAQPAIFASNHHVSRGDLRACQQQQTLCSHHGADSKPKPTDGRHQHLEPQLQLSAHAHPRSCDAGGAAAMQRHPQ